MTNKRPDGEPVRAMDDNGEVGDGGERARPVAANDTTAFEQDQPIHERVGDGGSQADQIRKLAQEAKPELPKRFYTDASVVAASDGSHAIHLDGRAVRTPARNNLSLPNAALAESVASEWRAQGERIDPQSMPLTRLANTTCDGVASNMQRVRDEIVQYAGSDLVCYRADTPAGLVAQQIAHWDPVLNWAADRMGADFTTSSGVMPVSQTDAALDCVAIAVSDLEPFSLAALHVVMTLTGSALIGLAVIDGKLTPDDAWLAAHVDEDWQISQWGEDAEASARRAIRRREFDAACHVIALTTGTAASR